MADRLPWMIPGRSDGGAAPARLPGGGPVASRRSRHRRPLGGVLAALLLLLLALPLAAAPAQTPEAAPGAAPRLVSLAPSLTEILFAIGAGDRLVGATTWCDHPAAARAVPRVGGVTSETIQLERVVAARPDVVLSIGLDQTEAVAALLRLGLRVEVLPTDDLADLFTTIHRLGRLSGRPSAAADLAADLRARIDRVRAAVAEVPPAQRPAVFYEVWDRPLMTAGPDTFLSELIELAGGRNVFSDLDAHYPEISPEAVVARDPQVILAPTRHGGGPVDVAEFARRPGWGRMRAVRSGRIHTVDGDLVARLGPRVVEALEIFAHLLHPSRVPAPGSVEETPRRGPRGSDGDPGGGSAP